MKKILLVDDDDFILEIATYVLQNIGGFQVVAEKQGKNVLSVIRKIKPDVLILDYMLDDMHGLEVMALVQREKEFQQIPVIFLTGITNSQTMQKMYDNGATGIITKPFDPMTLSQKLNEILTKSENS